MTLDVTKAIAAKSDQQNAEDYLTGPRTIKINGVKVNNGQEQPIHISFEGDDGKVWKPCKTTARSLAAIWGPDASRWVGLSCTLYHDPDVTWAGAKVGGIRVSHMEGLTQARTLMLSKAKGKRGAVVIKPLDVSDNAHPKPTTAAHTVDRAEMKRQSDAAKTMTPEDKREWWNGLTDEEKAVVKELAKDQPSN